MSLEELAKDYRAAAAPIRLRLRQLRQAKKQTQDREELFWIARRTAVLTTMLHELNELSELLEHYYEGGYYRNEKYRLGRLPRPASEPGRAAAAAPARHGQ